MCNVMVICPWGHMGIPVSIIRAPGILWTLELSNHWADSLQMKFIGAVLICRCATSWSFAHQNHMAMPMGIISTKTQQPPLSWLAPNQVHLKRLGLWMCNTMVIYQWGLHGHAHSHKSFKLELSGPVHVQCPGHLLSGATWAWLLGPSWSLPPTTALVNMNAGHMCKACNVSFGRAGPRLNIKTVLSTYGDFHVKDKTAVRTSYL